MECSELAIAAAEVAGGAGAISGPRGVMGGGVGKAAEGGIAGKEVKGSSSALQNFGGRTIDDLVESASELINTEGLTKAARALTKHASGQRASGTFPQLSGGIEKQNSTAYEIVSEILNNPSSTFSNLSRGGLAVRAPDGKGLRYNSDGSFSGFLDPRRQP